MTTLFLLLWLCTGIAWVLVALVYTWHKQRSGAWGHVWRKIDGRYKWITIDDDYRRRYGKK